MSSSPTLQQELLKVQPKQPPQEIRRDNFFMSMGQDPHAPVGGFLHQPPEPGGGVGRKSMAPGRKSMAPGRKSMAPGRKSMAPGRESRGRKSMAPGRESRGRKSMAPGRESMAPGGGGGTKSSTSVSTPTEAQSKPGVLFGRMDTAEEEVEVEHGKGKVGSVRFSTFDPRAQKRDLALAAVEKSWSKQESSLESRRTTVGMTQGRGVRTWSFMKPR